MSNNKNILLSVSNIVDLVNYADNSIVSRVVLETKNNSVTIFAFDKGQRLSEHKAPFDALVQVVDGEGEFIIDGISNIVQKGQMIIMPADIPHSVNADNKFKMILTMLRT